LRPLLEHQGLIGQGSSRDDPADVRDIIGRQTADGTTTKLKH